jgi:hypothetical protein
MAEKSKLSPSELARINANIEARKAKAATNKKASAKPKAEPKKAPTIEELKIAAADQKQKESAKSAEFTDLFESGKSIPSIDLGLKLRAPNKISENSNYHNALLSMIGDVRNRISMVENTAKKGTKTAPGVDEAGQPRDVAIDKRGKRRPQTNQPTLDRLAPAKALLSQAEIHANNSYNAHHAGGGAGALTAVESFTKATDTLVGALSHVQNVFGKDQKAGKVFRDPDYGNKNSPVNIDQDAKATIKRLANSYTTHALSRASASGVLPSNVVNEVKPQLARDYDTEITLPQVTAAMGEFAPKSDEEKAAISKAKMDKRARDKDAALKDKASKGGLNIVKPSEDYPSTPLSIKDIPSIPGANRTFSVSGEGQAESVGSYVTQPSSVDKSFRARYGRAQVQPLFEYNEKQNEASAAEMGKQYVKKTFVGSEAHTDPEAFFEKNQVRTHWVKNNKGRPEDFDSSEAAADISGYKAANKLETTPLQFDTRKASRLTVFTPNRKSTAEKLIFSPPPGTPEAERKLFTPMKGSFEAFHPSAAESTAAGESTQGPAFDKVTQEDVPEAVNKRQLSRAKASGAALSRKEGAEVYTSKSEDYDPMPEKATTGGVAKTEQAMAQGRKIHFMTGAGE